MEVREKNRIVVNKLVIQIGISVALLFSAVSRIASSHHSVSGFFDITKTLEIEGVLTSATWRNPHTVFQVDVENPSGEITEWHVETGALGLLQRNGLGREFVSIGDRIRILGNPSKRGEQEIWANNVLLSSGEEVLVSIMSRPYFSLQEGGKLIEPIYDEEIELAARRNADGIFRVWNPDSRNRTPFLDGNYPLTAAAKTSREEWSQSQTPEDIKRLGCTEWSMPNLMSNPAWMEFAHHGDDIVLRFFYNDIERIIYMTPNALAVPSHSLMGHSIGRWDNNTLIVDTTHIHAGRLDSRGTPQSSSIHIIERFTPSTDGERLDYEIDIEDPENFTEPFAQSRYWVWRPEIELGLYACGQTQQLQPFPK